MEITEAFIAYWARSETMASRARAIVGGFQSPVRNGEGSLLQAVYPGSAAVPYQVSADLSDPLAPLFQCSCPSRRRPCKHALGLLWAALETGERFAVTEHLSPLPPPAAKPRKKTAKPGPTPLPLDAAALDKAKQLINALLREGLDARTPALLKETKGQIRELSLPPAIRAALLRVYDELSGSKPDYSGLFDRLTRLWELVNRGLQAAGRSGEDADWDLDTALGRVWRFDELQAIGYGHGGLKLMQLAFWCEDDAHTRRYVDIGLWAELENAKIWETYGYRPYDTAKALTPEDSASYAIETEDAVCYPGTSRLRWNACRPLPMEASAFSALCRAAYDNTRDIRAFAADRLIAGTPSPSALLRFRDMGYDGGHLCLRDADGFALPLDAERTPKTLLESVYNTAFHTCLLRFHYTPFQGLTASPLCFLSETALQRLV